MVKKVFNCYISSKNRNKNEPIYDFRIDFPQGHIQAEEHERISLNVMSFDMINSMYNVSSINDNNKFSIQKIDDDDTIITTYTIPEGNYDVYSFNTVLNKLLENIISITYNTYQNTYTYKKIDTSSSSFYLNPAGASKLLGIFSTTEIISSGITGSFVNMINYNKIMLKVENLSFNRFQNLSDEDNVLNNGDVLFWITKSDVPPFKMISYENIDGGSSFHCDLHDKDVSAIQISLANEYNDLITDAPEFLLSLQFIINPNEGKVIKTYINKILLIVNEIFDLFVLYLKYIGFFRDIQK
jgi:hypothetical protein